MTSEIIKETSSKLGTDICGIATIERFGSSPAGFHPCDVYAGTKSVIVYGKQFPQGTFLASSNAPYTVVRNQLITEIDKISLELSYIIEKEGYFAVPIPSSEPYEYWDGAKRHGRGIISLKHSAHLAGLGSMGKNTLLINNQFGNRLWLGATLTNMVLEADPVTPDYCPEQCNICIESCPQNALNGISIDQKKCREICYTFTEGGGWLINCNKCRIECPHSGA